MEVMSQKCACVRSMTTSAGFSSKSKPRRNTSDEAKKILTDTARAYELASVQEMIDRNKDDIAAADTAGVQALTMEGADGEKYLAIANDAMWARVTDKVGEEESKKLRALLDAKN